MLPQPSAFVPPRSLLLALLIGAAGGALFAWFRLPLAWMMGAMCFNTVAALSGVPITVPQRLRGLMIAVLGVLLGSAFTPELLDQVGQWLVSFAGLVVYTAVVGAVALVYFRKVAGYGPVTAYFSAMPGGLNEMVLVGRAMGGDDRAISLVHGARILLVVLTIPIWFQFFAGYEPGGGGGGHPPIHTVPALELAMLTASGVVGIFLARLTRMPAGTLTGPMLVSAVVHLAGFSEASPPYEVIAVAQVVVGSAIGARFAGVAVSLVLRTIVVAFGSTVLMLAVTVAFGLGMHALTGIPFYSLVLALAPGGLAEMSLIALALGVDAAFVAAHHIVRIVLVVFLAPMFFRIMRRTAAGSSLQEPERAD